MIEHKGDTEEGALDDRLRIERWRFRSVNAAVGNSGGPLINASGRVIGLHHGCGHNSVGQKVNLAVVIDEGNNITAFFRFLNSMQPASGSAMHRQEQSVDNMTVGEAKDVGGFIFAW